MWVDEAPSREKALEVLLETLKKYDCDPPRVWALVCQFAMPLTLEDVGVVETTCKFIVPLGELSRNAARKTARQRAERIDRILPAPGQYVLSCEETDEKEVLV